jgi:sulfoxide reductase catalytic subunit YedY
MAHIVIRPDWYLPERSVTPEKVFLRRREFLRSIGLASAALTSLPLIGGQAAESAGKAVSAAKYPAARNPEFSPKWKLTNEQLAGSYNNFYEFSMNKQLVRMLVGRFEIAPWPIEIGGLCEKPMKVDVTELIEQFSLEERIYRLRCVEGWGMIVPWTGFPLRKLLEKVAPKADAKFVRFETFNRPDQAPGITRIPYPWPYTEGLRLDEAMNPLTMLVTGIYGKPLPKQHGAPIRLVVPWKYGYKSIKSITRIELVNKQPSTFWETIAPDEYPFESNVNPKVPHPRWSQATERVLDSNDRIKTVLYNGYGSYVAQLYGKT